MHLVRRPKLKHVNDRVDVCCDEESYETMTSFLVQLCNTAVVTTFKGGSV